MWVSKLNSLPFSIICLTVDTLSIHDAPILNPIHSVPQAVVLLL